MEYFKKLIKTRFIGLFVFAILAIIFLASLPGFQRQIDPLTYTEFINDPEEDHYTEDYEDFEVYRVYDEQELYDTLSGEKQIRGEIAIGCFVVAGFFGLLGVYDVYKDDKLTREAEKAREAKQKG